MNKIFKFYIGVLLRVRPLCCQSFAGKKYFSSHYLLSTPSHHVITKGRKPPRIIRGPFPPLTLCVSSSVDLQIMLNEFFNDKYTSLVFMSISLSRFHVLTTALLGFVVFSRFSSILSMDTRGALSVK